MNCLKTIRQVTKCSIVGFIDQTFKHKGPFKCEKVCDYFYRGSDASLDKIRLLSDKGIKIILNLKTISKEELNLLRKEAEKYGIKYFNIPVNPFKPQRNISRLIKIINIASKKKLPLFTHCTFGIDRTGFAVALERYLNEGIPMSKAIQEMKKHGHNLFHQLFFYGLGKTLKQIDRHKSNAFGKMSLN